MTPSFKNNELIIKNSDETLDKILESNCSVSRFGDGEFNVMLGGSINFQKHSVILKDRLFEIINSQHSNHIVCIPYVFKSLRGLTPKSKDYWRKYMNSKYNEIKTLLNSNNEYYDSLVTRVYIDHLDKSKSLERFKKFKKIWDGKNIVIVEGSKTRFGRGNNLLENSRSIKRIICPAESAFSKYQDIVTEVKKQSREDLILISLGPTATVLAYDLAKSGFQAIDIGHIDIEYEWFLQGTNDKIPIKNKYVNEVKGGRRVDFKRDIEYEEQIVKRIEE
ncbi:SP_1767 family glycosyltransferase [Alkalihalobacterium chitinilyticum]|uniref:SP_1767 family glycosyltransferase n=1 Tax=Alkalihalobacterium chitinilyticum TaxID=2980103 RepID=A0ABT5VB45_9BACI|nr:SP_1767 family glycosyltransferase [Alkalihalobacterium chitinilyticum]MDE5412674.1 SP_1767 family glycosyltransferase [Alkalihalobacterium chitinilyticum]